MFKKGIMLILVCLLFVNASAFSCAAEGLEVTASFSRETTKLTISGKADAKEGERMHLLVLKPGIEFESLISAQNMESAILRADEALTLADGSFSFTTFTMTSGFTLGNCNWRVSGAGKTADGSFYYSPLDKIIEIINDFDKTAESGIYAYLITDKNKDPLCLKQETCEVYESLSPEERKYTDAFLANGSYALSLSADEETVNEMLKTISEDFTGSVAISFLNDAKNSEEVKNAIEKYNDIYEFDETFGGLFDELSKSDAEKAQTELFDRIAKADRFENSIALNDFALTQRVLTALKISEWEALEEMITENNHVLELDLDDFNALSSYKKDKAMKALKESNAFDSVAELSKAISDAVDAQKESKGGSQGGGGGSKSSGASSTLVDYVKEPQKATPEENVKAEIFSDLGSVQWAKDAIKALYEKKIVNGKGDGKFCPNDTVTRAEFVKMLVLASDINEKADISFSDVKNGDWHYEYIAKGVASNLVTGFSGGTFKPYENIKRQDMAVIIYRLLEAKNVNKAQENAKSFTDENEFPEYAKKAIEKLAAYGIFSGDETGKFNPVKSASRAEAAKVIYSILTLLK